MAGRELDEERGSYARLSEALATVLAGGVRGREERRRVADLVDAEVKLSKTVRPFLSRTERFERAMDVDRTLQRIRRRMGWAPTDWRARALRLCAGENAPTNVHDMVFVPALRALGGPEQQAQWLALAEEHGIVGAYAQTELGHGSDVARLETTATLIPSSDEWDLHTPTLSAVKWWSGALGATATHAMVWARARVPVPDGGLRDLGPKPFLLAIRDPATGRPRPGLVLGDIGPKLGFAEVDNGFLRLDHVRVPRSAILGRTAVVARDGSVSTPPHAKAAYAGMMRARVGIVRDSSYVLQRATTIAVRYAVLRRQFTGERPPPPCFEESADDADRDLESAADDGPLLGAWRFVRPEPAAEASGAGVELTSAMSAPDGATSEERKLLDIPVHRARLFPPVALALASQVAGEALDDLFERATSLPLSAAATGAPAAAAPPPPSLSVPLSTLHVLSSTLKFHLTAVVADAIEECRRCCGGQGYSVFSGLPELGCAFVHVVTAEGDNVVLAQQLARALLKTLADHDDDDDDAASKDETAHFAEAESRPTTLFPCSPLLVHDAYLQAASASRRHRAALLLPLWCDGTVSADVLGQPTRWPRRTWRRLLQAASFSVLDRVRARMQASLEAGASMERAWDGVQAEAIDAATHHARLTLWDTLATNVDLLRGLVFDASSAPHREAPEASATPAVDPTTPPRFASEETASFLRSLPVRESRAVFEVLDRLVGLLAVAHVAGPAWTALLEAGVLSPDAGPCVRAALSDALDGLRPLAVPLVDAFGLSDHTLESAIARSDGKVNEALWQWAQLSPLNDDPEGSRWRACVAPLLREGRDAVARLAPADAVAGRAKL